MSAIFIDFEARSTISIVDVGAHVYAEHPTTEVLCAAWAVGRSGEIQLWTPDMPVPELWYTAPYWVAHNHDTEERLLVEKFKLPPGRIWTDTATLASAAGLPRALEAICIAMHLPAGKLSSRAMMKLCKPDKKLGRFIEKTDRPDLFEELYTYCKRDVECMQQVMKRLPPVEWVLPHTEIQLFELNERMNQRGITVDVDAVQIAQAEVNHHKGKLEKEFNEIFPGLSPRSPIKVAAALGIPNCTKATIRDALKTTDVGPRQRAMHLLKDITKSSNAKLKALARRTTQDSKLHGAMVFHGAGRTGRWSSMGVQLQNLPQGAGQQTDALFEALHAGVLSDIYDNPTQAVSSMLRGMLVGPIISGDFSQIEARCLVKLAGQNDALQLFVDKKDPYKRMASRIYGKPEKDITKSERFMGKQAVLACGYGLGYRGFTRILKTVYDIEIAEETALQVVTAFRDLHPKIVSLWRNTERLVKRALLENAQTWQHNNEVPGIGARCYKSWLCIQLPSKRVLWYYEPSLEADEKGTQLMYWGRNALKGGAWERVKTYGGKLVENITQAIARDIMGEAMLRLEAAGQKVLLTVHDEIVCEDLGMSEEEFAAIMKWQPAFWPGTPLDVEVQRSRRYQK